MGFLAGVVVLAALWEYCIDTVPFPHPKPEELHWPAPGSADTELGVFMGPEVSDGETKVYARVQA
jgi:hypothetical protein